MTDKQLGLFLLDQGDSFIPEFKKLNAHFANQGDDMGRMIHREGLEVQPEVKELHAKIEALQDKGKILLGID